MRLPWILWLPLAAGAGCEAGCEAAELSLFQAAHPSVPKSVQAEAEASNKLDFCLGTTGRCFDFPALHGISRGGRTVFNRCSEVVRAFERILGIVCDYSSQTQTLPLHLVTLNNFTNTLIQQALVLGGAIGSGDVYTSYMPILSPDFFNATTFIPYAVQEYSFLIDFQADLDLRLGLFAFAVHVGGYVVPTGVAHRAYTAVAELINDDHDGMEFTQGSGDNWKSDTFAAQLIGHTFIAGMLEPTYGNHLILDLSGEGFSTDRMQVLKRTALAIAPQSLLRARGFLETGTDGPTLTGVEVQVEPGKWLKFEPKDGTRWIMAKVTLFALANFLLQCFHTGIHLYTGAVTSAIKRSIPVGTNFGKAIQPNSLQTIFALFEQAAALHASHGAAFSGSVWNCNITEIWTLTVDIARFYFSTPDPPKDILGITDSSPDWWAGSSQSFYAPISNFADVVAAESTSDPINALALANLQTELQHVGIATNQSSVDVTTSEGLAKLTKNLLFVAGICHSHMYLGREFFTPLMGFVETAPFGHYLQPGWSIWDSLGFEAVVTKIWFTVPSTISQQMILAYGTTSGFSRGVPELGDGPYLVASNSNLNAAVTTFRASLDASRQQVYGIFGDFKNGTFVPGYLYPRQVKKPFGCAITQTSYI